tara:strand:- start:715 stop:1044 length:330 start_codon:yes stop_codon:yes gene_type:complete
VKEKQYSVYHRGTKTDFGTDDWAYIIDVESLPTSDLSLCTWEELEPHARPIIPNHLLDEAWEQAYELFADFEDLNDEDIISCREVMRERVKQIMACLHDYVPDNIGLVG